MGLFDSLTELLEAATPWSTVEAEAPASAGESGKDEQSDDKQSSDDGDKDGDDAESADEEEEEEEPEDPKEKLEEECKESKQCSPAKHHFDECVERVTSAEDDGEKKGPHEDCVEEFFHLAHCASQCAAPKLWQILK